MNYKEGKQQFIQAWGKMGTNWGVPRTMAQVHALLLCSSQPLCSDKIMEELKISRGNVNQNLRALIDWGLVHKQLRYGERKEYFYAEKDLWKIFCRIIKKRKKKELDPVLSMLDEVSCVEDQSEESQEFCRMIRELKVFSQKADSALNQITKSRSNLLINTFSHLIR